MKKIFFPGPGYKTVVRLGFSPNPGPEGCERLVPDEARERASAARRALIEDIRATANRPPETKRPARSRRG